MDMVIAPLIGIDTVHGNRKPLYFVLEGCNIGSNWSQIGSKWVQDLMVMMECLMYDNFDVMDNKTVDRNRLPTPSDLLAAPVVWVVAAAAAATTKSPQGLVAAGMERWFSDFSNQHF